LIGRSWLNWSPKHFTTQSITTNGGQHGTGRDDHESNSKDATPTGSD
jgi:hypothetical protein